MSWLRNHKCIEGRIVWIVALCGGESMGFEARYFRVHIPSLPLSCISHYFIIGKTGLTEHILCKLVVGVKQGNTFKDPGTRSVKT